MDTVVLNSMNESETHVTGTVGLKHTKVSRDATSLKPGLRRQTN